MREPTKREGDELSPDHLGAQEKVEMCAGLKSAPEAVEPASQKQMVSGASRVCGRALLRTIRVAYVAMPDLGYKEVRGRQAGEVLDPAPVREGRAKEQRGIDE